MNEVSNTSRAAIVTAPTQSADRGKRVDGPVREVATDVKGNVANLQEAQRKEGAERLEQQQAELEAALAELNRRSTSVSPSLQFEQDQERGITVIKVIDRDTGEIIRQLPPEAVTRASADGEDILPPLVNTEV
jgi:flagellar protein FlaG